MAVSYDPLWKTLIDHKMNRMKLAQVVGFSTPTLAKLGKDEYVALSVIDRICQKLDCSIEEVIKIIPENEI